MSDTTTTEYDGCGRCLVGVRRLSRMTDKTNSPEKQAELITQAATAIGGHIIAWADDWEVSGATNPLTREKLGPWLRDEEGPYSGIAGSAVDRIGRNQRDVLNTAYAIHESGRLLITHGHQGPWDLDDPADEMRLSMESFGAQMELRAIQKRNREEAEASRKAGRPKNGNRYGFRYVRLTPTGRVDHVEHDPIAKEIICNVAERILADETGMITVNTEATRLNREGVLSPRDYRRVAYGKEPRGTLWTGVTVADLLTSEGSLGYLLHKGKPVLDERGHPKRIAEGLWDHAKRDALIKKTKPKTKRGPIAPKGTYLLVTLTSCGNCDKRIQMTDRTVQEKSYGCTARVRGIATSKHCKPAPSMTVSKLNKEVTDWFLTRYGAGQFMEKKYDPGTGHAARISELRADRARLRSDRSAGLYDSEDDEQWYRTEYMRMGEEIERLKKLPARAAGIRWIPTGLTVADKWHSAKDDAERRELLAAFDVKVKLYPVTAGKRVRITGADIRSVQLTLE
ncbi:recombinase family protein [Streptomyces sp. NPDC059063]|uniref:recombinase family protein n=1 Tax=unclassified Streptomyces TaxID=2593676 RepID=UPI00368E472B